MRMVLYLCTLIVSSAAWGMEVAEKKPLCDDKLQLNKAIRPSLSPEEQRYIDIQLRQGIKQDDIQLMWLAIYAGADVNIINEPDEFTGSTFFMKMVAQSRFSMVAFLIDHGADVHVVNPINKWTILHYAVAGKHEEILYRLINLGADIHAKNSRGQTPFDLASELGLEKIECILTLVAAVGPLEV